ncbi:MAG: acetyltransferase [bacterium]
MRTKIVIIGGKGSAIVIAEQIYDAQVKGNDVEFLGFAFDDESFGKEINGFPIICKTFDAKSYFEKYIDVKFIYQLYRPDLMKERIELLDSFKIPLDKFCTFVHPSALIAKSANIGIGTCILANAVINPKARIGNFNTIHSNTLIGHDTSIGEYNFFAAHSVVGSNDKIGNGNFIGLNTSFNNYITIGDFCFVGMASNVIKSIESHVKVIGNPARPFNNNIKAL